MSRGVKDYFSDDSSSYNKYRPEYPHELFEYLSSVAPGNEKAWDCATGTGQSARSLAKFFRKVIATDVSESQIKMATKDDGIVYLAAPAEQTGIESGTVDLITVAQALHWFDIKSFFKEAERVLQTNGILAIWSYDLLEVSSEIDRIINRLYSELREFWPPERRLVEERYRGIEFPFAPVYSPSFEMGAEWNMDQVVGYISTWSAVKRYRKERNVDPAADLRERLSRVWGDTKRKVRVRWPLTVIIRRKVRQPVRGR